MEQDQTKRTEVSEYGEFGLIDHLTKDLKIHNSSTIKGVGDDAAVIDNDGFLTVVSTDMMVEGIHFDLMYFPLKHLGYKAIVSNLSDICAMNARPRQVTVSVAISNRFSVEAMDELYAGMKAACDAYQVDLVGGDTTSSNRGLIISVTAIGQGEKDKLVYRNGAKPGDLICITGDLGAAYLGLQLLEREKQLYLQNPDVKPDLEEQKHAVGRFLKPEARMDMIEILDKAQLVPTAMIDISDGLSSDLMHICKQSGVGAIVEETGVPIHSDTKLLALKFNLDPINCALNGGEDYELLFTIDEKDVEKIRLLPDIWIAGEITEKEEGLKLHTSGGKRHDLFAQGWKHF
ncbi:MAG: thiamine-phosphate kinase [Bacteroidetes bacterium]|nr:MAG: thiamine-phosphate kinase [Bacteroidota bacterium]